MSIPVVVYSGRGCHLCEVALAVLERDRERLDLEIEVVDITADPDLERAYREQIPVVFVGGRKAFKYHVDPLELERRVQRLKVSQL